MLRTLIMMVVLGSIGCAGERAPSERLRDDIPDPGAETMELVSPVFTIEPGQRRFLCMQMPFRSDEDLYVNGARIFQTSEGHHALVLHRAGGHGADPDPHPCEAIDMVGISFVTAGAANGAGLSMPPGVALKIPRGAEIWVQTHYTNSTEDVLRAQDVVQLDLIPAAEVREVASVVAQVDAGFEIPAGGRATTTMTCEFAQEMTIPWVLPHMHEAGTEFEVEFFADDGDTLYSWKGAWLERDRHMFPILQFPDPLVVQPGDGIRTTCRWRNEGEAPLAWPAEMCVSFFPFYPGDGSLVTCDQNGVWSKYQAP